VPLEEGDGDGEAGGDVDGPGPGELERGGLGVDDVGAGDELCGAGLRVGRGDRVGRPEVTGRLGLGLLTDGVGVGAPPGLLT
jgi:hypothetical protein